MIEKAKELVGTGQCTVAAVTPDGGILTGRGSSVRPLLDLYRRHRSELAGAAVADRIVGRAASCILCAAGAGEVFAFVLSQSGKEQLERYNIPVSWHKLVPFIANLRGDDLCPMERTVEGVDDLNDCLDRLAEFADGTRAPDIE